MPGSLVEVDLEAHTARLVDKQVQVVTIDFFGIGAANPKEGHGMLSASWRLVQTWRGVNILLEKRIDRR
jgi:hypothetical protein